MYGLGEARSGPQALQVLVAPCATTPASALPQNDLTPQLQTNRSSCSTQPPLANVLCSVCTHTINSILTRYAGPTSSFDQRPPLSIWNNSDAEKAAKNSIIDRVCFAHRRFLAACYFHSSGLAHVINREMDDGVSRPAWTDRIVPTL